MAYVDAQLMFSDAQAITADAASTNIIDLGVARNLFQGEPMAIVISSDVAADLTTTDETYSVIVQTDDNSSFSSATALTTQAIPAADLAAGDIVVLGVPSGSAVERYLRLSYDVGGTTPTVTLTAYLSPLSMVPANAKHYGDAITIS
jgi:RES domain-containing protein